MERYNEYKDSGVQWLGEIPSHWEVVRLKSVIKDSQSGVWGEDPKHDGSDTLCLRVADFNYNNGYLKEDNLTYRNYGKELSSNKQLQMRDLLLEKSGGGDLYPVGRVVRYNFNGIVATCSNFIQKLTPRDNVDSDFIYYLFRTMYYLKVNGLYYNQTTGIQNLKVKEYLSQTVFLPPLSEQQAIANYLDTATAKIDEAIAQQQKMIDLLNERKQIIINNAVTKGLNPDAPMKDSGVDWIGEIPEHWIITKLKHLVEITDGTHDTPRYVDPSSNTYPLVTSRCIVNGVIDLSLANHITEQDYNYIATRSYVRRNDVIMPMIGTVGNPAIVDFEDSIAIKNVALFRTNGDINIAKFLKYLLNSTVVKEQFAMYNKGGVQNFVSQEILKNLAIIVPDNITDIVGFLEREIAKIETPIIAHNRQISLLQERKQIIINDVVTGKVKVS